jgi:hypothetical protein
MRLRSVVTSMSRACSRTWANARSFSRQAMSLATTQSCGSRKTACARPVELLDQWMTRSRQPFGSTAVRTLTPWA